MAGRERDDQRTMVRYFRIRDRNHAAVGRGRKCVNGALHTGGVASIDRAHFHTERRGDRLNGAKLGEAGRKGGITKNRDTRDARRNLFEKLQPFGAEAELEQ